MTTGGMPVIEVDGIREVTNALRRLDKDAAAQLRKDWKAIGDRVAGDVPALAVTLQQRASGSRGFRGMGDRDGPIVQLRNLASMPFAVAAYMGARARFGNYGWRVSNGGASISGRAELSRRRRTGGASKGAQFPAWIGNQHTAGDNPQVGSWGIPWPVDKAIDANARWLANVIANRLDKVGKDLAQ